MKTLNDIKTKKEATEINTLEELKSIEKGRLIKLCGEFSNGIELIEEGWLHEPFNGTITLIKSDGEDMYKVWISLNSESKKIVCEDYKGDYWDKEIIPEIHQDLLNAWRSYQK